MRKYTLSLVLLGLSIILFFMLNPPFIYVLEFKWLIFTIGVFFCLSCVASLLVFFANFIDSDECGKLVKFFFKVIHFNFYRKNKTTFNYSEYKQIKKHFKDISFFGEKAILSNTHLGEKALFKRTFENRTEYIYFVNKEMIDHSTSLPVMLDRARNPIDHYRYKIKACNLQRGLPNEVLDFFKQYKNVIFYWHTDRWYVANTPHNWHDNCSKEELRSISKYLIDHDLLVLISNTSTSICPNDYYSIKGPVCVARSNGNGYANLHF